MNREFSQYESVRFSLGTNPFKYFLLFFKRILVVFSGQYSGTIPAPFSEKKPVFGSVLQVNCQYSAEKRQRTYLFVIKNIDSLKSREEMEGVS